MRFPFRDEFDDLFRHDRAIWVKMGGGAAAAALVVAMFAIREFGFRQRQVDLSPAIQAIIVAVAPILGAVVAILLSLKDTVERRQATGQSVSWLLRVYFGNGRQSLILWFMTSLGVAFIAIIILFGCMGL